MNDKALFDRMKTKLFTAVVGDVLDTLGYRNQFLPQAIKPLLSGTKLAGRAMPVLESDYDSHNGDGGHGPLSEKPFGVMFEALDSLREDEIYIASGSSLNYALWGGLMSTRALHLKAAGAILNGFIRDTNEIRNLGFAVFSQGSFAQDQGIRGKVLDYGVPIQVGPALVNPGDLIFADDEGVLVIPRAVETEAIELALEKASTENSVAKAIKAGMSTVDAFEKFGVM